MHKQLGWLILCWLGGLLSCQVAWAAGSPQDTRVALLIAHQHGWKSDPPLRYVISGDLMPLRRLLDSNGFQVLSLRNPSPAAVRRIFQRLLSRREISTFLFYYSGHGGKQYFHLGPRGSTPLSYDEFISFFRKLRVKRRIALLDACFSGSIIRRWGKDRLRHLRRHKYTLKGARYTSFSILTKAKKYRSMLKGTQIIASSLSYSYESQGLKSSVFTHYLLQGLKGEADLNGDGQVSVDELFGYIKPRLRKDAEQPPYRMAHIEGDDYGLTSNLTSRLFVKASVVGRLSVTIGNFHWRYQKRRKRSIRMRVIHGIGMVEWKRGERCFQQQVTLPKGGQAQLGNRWKQASCQHRFARTTKGLITLPPQVTLPWQWSAGAQGGLLGSPLGGGSFLGSGYLALRHSYFALMLGALGSNVDYIDSSRSHQLLVELRGEGGYRYVRSRLDIFAGGYTSFGLLLKDITSARPQWGLVFGFGLTTTLGLWLTSFASITLSGDLGFSLLQQGNQQRRPFGAAIRLGFLQRFG